METPGPMSISLNNRHKIGIFITALTAGLCLVLGEPFRETSVVIVIGLALAWAFGSPARAPHYCIGSIGALLFFTPLIADVIDHHTAVRRYEESLNSFRSRLPQFAKEHPDLSGGLVAQKITALPPGAVLAPLPRTFTVPNIGMVEFPGNMSSRQVAAALRADKDHAKPPEWYYEALDAGVDPTETERLVSPDDPPKALNMWRVFSDGMIFEIPSLLLAILFLGSVIFEHKRSAKSPS